MLPLTWNVVLVHFQVGLSLYAFLNWTLREEEAPQKLLPPLEDEHLEGRGQANCKYLPKGKPSGSHMVSWYLHKISYLVSPILIVLLNTNCKLRCSVTNNKC